MIERKQYLDALIRRQWNDHMSGDFQVLKTGLNAISLSGNVTSIVIYPR